MTCQQFKLLNNWEERSPLDMTIAERTTSAKHFDGCPECYHWLVVSREKAEERMTLHQRMWTRIMAIRLREEIMGHDYSDPEAIQ